MKLIVLFALVASAFARPQAPLPEVQVAPPNMDLNNDGMPDTMKMSPSGVPQMKPVGETMDINNDGSPDMMMTPEGMMPLPGQTEDVNNDGTPDLVKEASTGQMEMIEGQAVDVDNDGEVDFVKTESGAMEAVEDSDSPAEQPLPASGPVDEEEELNKPIPANADLNNDGTPDAMELGPDGQMQMKPVGKTMDINNDGEPDMMMLPEGMMPLPGQTEDLNNDGTPDMVKDASTGKMEAIDGQAIDIDNDGEVDFVKTASGDMEKVEDEEEPTAAPSPSSLDNEEQPDAVTDEMAAAEDAGTDPEAAMTEADTTDVIEAAPEGEDNDATAAPVEEGPMTDMTSEDVPPAPRNSVRRILGQYKLRFLHRPNREALKKILLRKGFIGFLRAAFKFNKDKKGISFDEWKKMYKGLDKYWSQRLGVKIPVTKENWAAVAKGQPTVSIRKNIIPALFFEKDRGLFDAIWSALFWRVFDFDRDGLITHPKPTKTIKGKKISERTFHNQGVQWVKDLLALPKAQKPEIKKMVSQVAQEQGPEMAKEMKKLMMVEGLEGQDNEEQPQQEFPLTGSVPQNQ